MCVCAVLDDVLSGNGERGPRAPSIEPRRLRNIEGRENPVVRHRPPSQREILGDEISERIEAVAFATQDSRFDVIARPER